LALSLLAANASEVASAHDKPVPQAAQTALPEAHLDFLNRYIGTWNGTYTLKEGTTQLATFSTEHTYRWSTFKGLPVVLGTLVTDNPALPPTQALLHSDGQTLYLTVYESTGPKEYIGTLSKANQSITWVHTAAASSGAQPVSIVETFALGSSGWEMLSKSTQQTVQAGVKRTLVIDGRSFSLERAKRPQAATP
jgi:hypothetical protein